MKLTKQEKEELAEINRLMAPLQKIGGISKELFELGNRRSHLLNKLYNDGETYYS